jgi:hypothetical protein
VVQFAGEAERLRCCAALGHAEGAEAEAGGGEGRARVVEGLAHGAERVVQLPGAGAGVQSDRREISQSLKIKDDLYENLI